jgi:hypothetical protein
MREKEKYKEIKKTMMVKNKNEGSRIEMISVKRQGK